MNTPVTARVDAWLWSVRVYKTRSEAADACRGGHVTVNGKAAKPATTVAPGDRVAARSRGWDRVLEVVDPIHRRVGPGPAAACFVDHSPPPPAAEEYVVPVFRDRGTGRPTKRDRRAIERLRDR